MRFTPKIKTAKLVLQNFGLLEVAKIVIRKITGDNKTLQSGYAGNSSFRHVVSFSEPSEDFLIRCGLTLSVNDQIHDYKNYLDRFTHFAKRPRSSFFGEIYDLGPGLGFLLFYVVGVEIPKKVIETGVAAGSSSNLILTRFNHMGHGELVSVDITEKVGELVESNLRNRWSLIILPKLFKRKALLRILDSNKDATIFLHDSDHSIDWQIFEISSVIKTITAIKYILVDDVTVEFESYVLNNLPDWKLIVIDEGKKFSGYLFRKN